MQPAGVKTVAENLANVPVFCIPIADLTWLNCIVHFNCKFLSCNQKTATSINGPKECTTKRTWKKIFFSNCNKIYVSFLGTLFFEAAGGRTLHIQETDCPKKQSPKMMGEKIYRGKKCRGLLKSHSRLTDAIRVRIFGLLHGSYSNAYIRFQKIYFGNIVMNLFNDIF